MQVNTINYYEENANILINRYESANVNEVQNLLLSVFDKQNKLLEIGCGSGRDASFMLINGYEVFAVDGSKNMIKEAKKIHPELSKNLFYKILPNDLSFNIRFDGVYSVATLMHLSKNDLSKTISKIFDLLNLNGKFLMSVSLCRDDINKDGFDNKGRFFLVLEPDEWLKIFKDIGFKILETKINKDGLNRDGIEWFTLVAQK